MAAPSAAASIPHHGGSVPARRAPVRGCTRLPELVARCPSAHLHPWPPARRSRTSVRGRQHAVRSHLRPSAAARASVRACTRPRLFIHLLPPIEGSPAPRAASALASPSPAVAPTTQSAPAPTAVPTAASAALSSASAGAPPRCWLCRLTCSLRRPHRHRRRPPTASTARPIRLCHQRSRRRPLLP